jgi:hypothetical protein
MSARQPDEKEENMNQRLILIVTLIVITVIALLTQRHTAHSATFAAPLPAASAEFAARPIGHSINGSACTKDGPKDLGSWD